MVQKNHEVEGRKAFWKEEEALRKFIGFSKSVQIQSKRDRISHFQPCSPQSDDSSLT